MTREQGQWRDAGERTTATVTGFSSTTASARAASGTTGSTRVRSASHSSPEQASAPRTITASRGGTTPRAQLQFPEAPSYHRFDPVTSIEADLRHSQSGKKQRHADLVLAAVTARPGRTAAEYGELTGLGRYEAARRLSDLKFKGVVQMHGRATYQGTSQSLWFLTAETASAQTPAAS